MIRVPRRVALPAVLVAMVRLAGAAPGNLDSTFGLGGKVVSSHIGTAHAVVLQPDGKIVAAGSIAAARPSDSDPTFALARYNPDGTLDPGFDRDGWTTASIGRGATIFGVALQPDGKLVAVGRATVDDFGRTAVVLARFNGDGTLDESFGSAGTTTVDPVGYDFATSVVVQPDGRIVTGGVSDTGAEYSWMLLRHNANGTLDTSFGTLGRVVTHLGSPGANDLAFAVALQQDGKIVAVGEAYTGSRTAFALARYHGDGTLDATFGNGGTVVSPFPGDDDYARAVVIQPDGKLVAVGAVDAGPTRNFALARYNADGSPDASFGSMGQVVTPIPGFAFAVALQPDGKIVAVGHLGTGDRFVFGVARFHVDGTLDAGLGSGGTVTAPIGSGEDGANAVALQPDGKIVAVGYTDDTPTDSHGRQFALARFQGGPTPVCGLDSDGDGVCDALDNCASTTNLDQANGDADAVGDACDPCTNVAGTGQEKAKLVLTKLLVPLGDESFTLKGVFTNIPDISMGGPAIDPVTHGLRVVITDSEGATPVDISIPGGAYNVTNKTGWLVDGSGTTWTYKSAGSSVTAIRRARVRALSEPGTYDISLNAAKGSYQIISTNLPLVGTVVFDTPMATTGQCAEAVFWAALAPAKPRCASAGGGQTVKCR